MSSAAFLELPLSVLPISISLLLGAGLFASTLLLIRYSHRQKRQPGRQVLWRASGLVGLLSLAFLIETIILASGLWNDTALWPIRAACLAGASVLLFVLIPTGRRMAELPPRTILEQKNQLLSAELERIRHANEVIALSEARYRLLMDTVAEGIWIVDRIGRISFANPRLADMQGTPAEQLKGRAVLELVPEEERPSIISMLQRQQRGESVRTLCHLLRPDGKLVAVQISSTPLSRGAESGSSLSVITDLSDQMKVQEQLRKLAADLEEQVQGRTKAYRETAERLAATLDASQAQSRAYSILQDMNDMLQACTTPTEAARVAGEFAIKLFGADSGSIYVTEPAQSTFRLLGSWGLQGESSDMLQLTECWGLRQNQAYPHNENQLGLRCHHLTIGPHRHSCCMPMFANGQASGMISLRSDQPFINANPERTAADQKIQRLFSANVAQFLANLSLRQSLEQQSLRDPLTNLFNRRYFNEQLAIEFERASRARSPLAIQMVDIDHFKRINDRYGHEAGDRVLRQVSEVLTQNARAGDIVCRWGGEEFLILMPGLNGTSAKRRADEIRRRVQERVETVGGSAVSVSIGVAAYPEHATDPDGLINVSDRALYASKGAGRNRVTLAVTVL
ncbi:MAG: sensor domain-containing diguanylate cyclase [Lautropia sp.]|nr:sensor domain-containing diguanylate cyclase [Lautropia sp.]